MIYKDFKNLKLSALGMGAMRLPTIDGDDAKIDAAATQEMVDYALSHGHRLGLSQRQFRAGDGRGAEKAPPG